MNKALDLSNIYSLRQDYTIIGLTGRTGSGCTEVARQLAKGFNVEDFNDPNDYFDTANKTFNHNSYRKYKIIYNYAKVNFYSYELINYKDILVLFILKEGFDKLEQYLSSDELFNDFQLDNFLKPSFDYEILELKKILPEFKKYSSICINLIDSKAKSDKKLLRLYKLFFNDNFKSFCDEFHRILSSKSLVKRNRLLQSISDNLRRSGSPYKFDHENINNIFCIVEVINDLIKSHKKNSSEPSTKIVIDSLRNPIEIMFFRQRFSAFYSMSVNQVDNERLAILKDKYGDEYTQINKILDKQYKGGKGWELYKQNVSSCIQAADIHVTFQDSDEVFKLNKGDDIDRFDNASPYFTWQMQLLKFIALIGHPGLITPSPEERCMQLAYTAKYNSGCISRQVGAAITDENYSVKAIGWNNTPEGQVPCVLRNAEDLISGDGDMGAFTQYEKRSGFKKVLKENFSNQIDEHKENLKGRNVCFCFKTLKNSVSEGKNQVHTRSLHAEESAFLQISKYGGIGIRNGKLFTTASPCELCAKKAYQLGIKVIYFIDPYPGISQAHILGTGSQQPTTRLFNGAIGNAYHWLYEPLMPYKDELSVILGQEILDLTTQQKNKIDKLEKENSELQAKIKELEG